MGGMGGNSKFQEGQFGGNGNVHGGLGGDSHELGSNLPRFN